MSTRTRITNQTINQLLLDLGFERGEETEKHNCYWRHPDVGTTFVLPANKALEEPLQVDLADLRMKLAFNGHLSAEEFDGFLESGSLTHV